MFKRGTFWGPIWPQYVKIWGKWSETFFPKSVEKLFQSLCSVIKFFVLLKISVLMMYNMSTFGKNSGRHMGVPQNWYCTILRNIWSCPGVPKWHQPDLKSMGHADNIYALNLPAYRTWRLGIIWSIFPRTNMAFNLHLIDSFRSLIKTGFYSEIRCVSV